MPTEPSDLAALRPAVVHDWLTGMRGGEAVLEAILDLFPRAEIFTLIHLPGSVSKRIERHPIHVSPAQRLPGVARRYRYWLPLFPWAVRRLDVRDFDLVVSISHCVAKGIPTRGVPHWCYCNTPMRYVWDRFDDYFGPDRPAPSRLAMRLLRGPLQRWDAGSNDEVGHFVGNSRHVAGRIERYYHRPAEVIWPPVSADRFSIAEEPEDFWLIVSALAPYKRIDLAIEAFRGLGRRLVVVGTGQDEHRLRELARGADVELLGWRSDEEVAALLRRCRAFILPGEEDFGITPLEAMASGRPVLALGRGGALDTVVDSRREPDRAPTGVLFEEPTVDSLRAGVERLERELDTFDPLALRRHAESFDLPRFRREVADSIRAFLAAR